MLHDARTSTEANGKRVLSHRLDFVRIVRTERICSQSRILSRIPCPLSRQQHSVSLLVRATARQTYTWWWKWRTQHDMTHHSTARHATTCHGMPAAAAAVIQSGVKSHRLTHTTNWRRRTKWRIRRALFSIKRINSLAMVAIWM